MSASGMPITITPAGEKELVLEGTNDLHVSSIKRSTDGDLGVEVNAGYNLNLKSDKVLFKYAADSEGALWKEYHIGASSVSIGQSGATQGVSNASLYWILDAVTEYLYFGSDLDDDWDANSDVQVEVWVALENAETANDLIRASLRADYYASHDVMGAKTQTRSIDHNIESYNAQGSVHELVFILDWDLADNVMEIGDIIKLRFWLDDITTAPVVTGVRVLFAALKYRTKYALPQYSGFDSEG